MKNHSVWGDFSLEQGKIKHIRIADLFIYFHLLENEIKISHTYSDSSADDTANLDLLAWKRWPLHKSISKILVQPVQPDRPVLVKPESSLNLPGLSNTSIFCRLPVSIRISMVIDNKSIDLIDILSVKLSNTWFGTFKEGEICYSITSGTRTQMEPDLSRPFMAICTVKLKNLTKEPFQVDKICLRSDFLTLYLHKEQIWTDTVSISYDGKNEISEVNFAGRPPYYLSRAKLITKPKQTLKKSLYASSFSTIKDLYGSGLFASK